MELSLINVSLAALVVLLVASVCLPLAGGMASAARLEEAAMRLASELQAAQQLAIASGDVVEVTFASHQDFYVIRQITGTTPDIKRVYLPPGVSWRHISYNQTLRFNPSGENTQNGRIELKNQEGAVITVVIALNAGRVRVERGVN